MDRSVPQTVLIAILAIVALALVAATLTSTITPQEPGVGVGESDAGGRSDGGLLPEPTPHEPAKSIEIPFLTELVQVILVLTAIAMAVYLYLYRYELFQTLLVIVAFFGLVYILAQILTLIEPGYPSFGDRGRGLFGGGPGIGSGSGSVTPPLILLIVLGLVVVGVAVALHRSTPDLGDTDSESPSPEAAAVGAAAGHAADHLEASDVDVGNAVYRAWLEMTELLDVANPATTPGEFAAAAVDAGMNRADVTELTRLFEDVRYGGQEPTSTDEERAITVLRRIEAAYAGPDEEEP